VKNDSWLLKNAHLRRSPHPSSLRRTSKYAALLTISGALHLDFFEQPRENHFFTKLLAVSRSKIEETSHLQSEGSFVRLWVLFLSLLGLGRLCLGLLRFGIFRVRLFCSYSLGQYNIP
jgi:hypothetical protein